MWRFGDRHMGRLVLGRPGLVAHKEERGKKREKEERKKERKKERKEKKRKGKKRREEREEDLKSIWPVIPCLGSVDLRHFIQGP